MKQLHHNGVLVPPRYVGKGLTLKIKGEQTKLTPEQEEMALAWTKKLGTKYSEDHVFAKNFHRDFSKKLGLEVKPGDVDYSEVLSFVEEERQRKGNLSKTRKKSLAAQRKAQREVNKERYGHAWVDGVQVEVANYAAEPSCVFMGRGKHPLRGRWKEGPRQEDVELNLSPDALKPAGNWKAVLWQPDAMWIARWRDKLTGKMKYVWFSDSSLLKQKKDIEKFDKARELIQNLDAVQEHIWENLDADDERRRKTATVCFLIDKLKIRVGDEKDPDEADTVGASTLRPEHIHHNGDGSLTFKFLGKDAVPHVFKVDLPENMVENLKEFAANASSALFDGVRSKHVSGFLDEVLIGLSAKVFRTCYASEAVKGELSKVSVKPEEPDYKKKYVAKMANLEAAKVCNHRRSVSKRWKSSLEKKKERLKKLRERSKKAQDKLKQRVIHHEQSYRMKLRKYEERLESLKQKLAVYQQELEASKEQGKTTGATRKRVSHHRKAISRERCRLRTLKTRHREQMKKLKCRLKARRQRDKAAINKLKLEIATKEQTRDYNLNTSLKSYIDPRIYYRWGHQVDYDWKQYYPKALRSKFSWVENEETLLEND